MESTSKILKYLSRLREVRAKRLAMAAAVAAADAEAAAMGMERAGGLQPDNDDLVSEAPSMVSGFSMYTDRTTTATMGGASSSSRAPSTVGGKKALKGERKASRKGKIKQGSPLEEGGLVGHIMGLGPPKHALEEAGQLTELLCLFGHLEDAQKLQQGVAEWQQQYNVAVQDIKENPVPVEAVGSAAAGGGAGGGGGGQGAGQAKGGGASAAETAAAAGVVAHDVRWKWDILRL